MRKFKERLLKTATAPRQNEAERTRSSSPSQTPIVSFPDGLRVLHDSGDATVDICFVHGLTGNRDTTWTAKGQSQPWPQTLLAPQLSSARILSYGYDAYVVKTSVASSNRLIDHASNLLNDLTTDRASHDAADRPLIFVAHSLGGLVCKEAILQSRNNPESHLKKTFECTKGIIFMGTPHAGSWIANWATLPASALGIVKSTNKTLLKILQTDDQLLESVQVRFLAMIRDLRENNRRLEVTCFFEELPLPVVGKVVSKESATFPGYNPISIHANHSDMVRFASPDETGYKRVLGELTRWTTELRSSTQSERSTFTDPSR
jgi:protein SERAC1